MRNLGTCLFVALAAASALPAAASPAFDAVKKVCGDSHADFAAIKTALSVSGWAPAEVLPTNMAGVTPTEGIARTSTVGNERITIYAWEGPKPPYVMTACTAHVTKLELGAAKAESKTWLGFPPETDASGKATWRFRIDEWRPRAGQERRLRGCGGGQWALFFNVFADNGEVVIDLLKIKH